jgi:hypothetical protein
MTARCSKCGLDKPLDAFPKRSDRPRGVGSRCRDCLRSRACADCGTPVSAQATYCLACRFKGDRNPIAGTVRPEHVKQAVSRAHFGVPEKPRPRKQPKNPHVGRGQANSMFVKPVRCERCGQCKPLDWHHINDDATDNRRENVTALCRRCHQIVDGRHEALRQGLSRSHHISSSNSSP